MKKGRLIFGSFFFMLSLSCTDQPRVPDGILPPPKMQAVMWDMLRTGEFLDGFVFDKDTSVDRAALSQQWYEKIYKIHGIQRNEFDQSYTYYKEHPELMKTILDSLSKMNEPDRRLLKKKTAAADSSRPPSLLLKKDSTLH